MGLRKKKKVLYDGLSLSRCKFTVSVKAQNIWPKIWGGERASTLQSKYSDSDISEMDIPNSVTDSDNENIMKSILITK